MQLEDVMWLTFWGMVIVLAMIVCVDIVRHGVSRRPDAVVFRRSAATELVQMAPVNDQTPESALNIRPADGTNGFGPVETPRTQGDTAREGIPERDTLVGSMSGSKSLAIDADGVTTVPTLHFSGFIPKGVYTVIKPAPDYKSFEVRTIDDSQMLFSYTPDMNRIEVPDIRGFVHICYEGSCASVSELFEAWRK